MSFPRVVALDTDWTIFWGSLDLNIKEDNIEPEDGSEWVLRDRTCHTTRVGMYNDVPNIIHDILSHGAKLAIVAQNKNKAACDRALWWFKAKDPRDNQRKPIIDMVDFDEVYGGEKTTHFRQIQKYTGFGFSDMILFDDEATNNLVRVELGVTFQVSRDQKGLTWDNYHEGIALWKRVQDIRSPYIDQRLLSYSSPMFIGYSGMDEQTIHLLTQGKNRVDLTESARWGYAMYITDDIRIAKFFTTWIKADAFGLNTSTFVCEIWARDAAKFLATNKIWFPENLLYMTNNKTGSPFNVAWSQEDRDARAARWGVQTPYILFSRHIWLPGLPISWPLRWNEMVIYTQIQEALVLTIPLNDQQVNEKIQLGGKFVPYEKQVKNWNIQIPTETSLNCAVCLELNLFS